MASELPINPPFKLAPAEPSDLDGILQLLKDSHLPTDGVADHMHHFLTIRRGIRLIGCAGLEIYGHAALLRSVAVEGKWRNQSFGFTLVNAALDWARGLGVRQVFLLTETAAPYFQKIGFRPITRTSVDPGVQTSVEFVSACPISAQAMCLDIRGD